MLRLGCGHAYDKIASARLVYPNGLESQFTYDDLNRVKGVSLSEGGVLASYYYQIGPNGNRTGATESNGRTAAWSYDNIYRLTNETISLDPHSVNGSVGYGLDPVGNRQQQTSSIPGIGSGSFTLDADDRLTTETYDANGNTVVSGARTFTYDFENHLKSVTMGGNAVTIVYDVDGNRVGKTVNGVTTRYLVDTLNPTGNAQVVEEVTAGAVTRTYTYGLQRISQNQQISNTWTPSFYGYDGFGSVRLLTGSAGPETDTYDYDAWGNAVNTTGSTPNLFLYRGEQYDPDLGLYYLRARYLDPATGRFMSTDPAPSFVGAPATLPKYLYASADPVGQIDPTGRSANGDQGCSAGLLIFTIQSGGYLALSPGPLNFFRVAFAPKPVDQCTWVGGGSGGSAAAAKLSQPGPSTGAKTCNACAEADDIYKSANNANRRLDNLRRTGTALDPNGGGTPGGASGCSALYTVKGHIYMGNQYHITMFVTPEEHPCREKCQAEHEAVHETQCANLGLGFFKATERELEIPAYTKELECLLKLLKGAGLPPSRGLNAY
jgi:RHS repeat-associated protein